MNPARVVIGSDAANHSLDWPTMLLTGLYSSWMARDRLLVMSTSSAELAKIASNAMIAQRISSVNSLSAICEDAGASISDVTTACGLDPRIGPDCLRAGLGFGGSCLEKDLLGLVEMATSQNLYQVAIYWAQVWRINRFQRERLVHRLKSLFDYSVVGVKVAFLGFAYKTGTADAKGSLTRHLIEGFLISGAQVSIHDPLVSKTDILNELPPFRCANIGIKGGEPKTCAEPYEACYQADLVVITMDVEAYRLLRWDEISTCLRGKRTVFDTCGVVDKAELARHGIVVLKVGE